MKAYELVGQIDSTRHIRATLPADIDLPENQSVRVIVFMPEENEGSADALSVQKVITRSDVVENGEPDSLLALVESCRMDAGIEDLGHQHDHYLHGTLKKPDWKP